MPVLEKVCGAWHHDMTTCQDVPRDGAGVCSVCGPRTGQFNGRRTRKPKFFLAGVLMRISSNPGTSPPSSRSDRVQ